MPKVKIADIKIGTRHRKDMGDLQSLADSISGIGLLHPIVIDPNNSLIVGQRRIEACKFLGLAEIEANVANDLETLEQLLKAEIEENTCRESLKIDAQASIIKALLPIAKKLAEKEHAEASRSGGRPKSPKNGSAICTTVLKGGQDNAKRTWGIIGKAIGKSPRTAEKIFVVSTANSKLLAEAIKKDKIDGAYRKLKALEQVEAEKKAAKACKADAWKITNDQDVIECSALITDPPYGILKQDWEPTKLETFTREWATRWSKCNADLLAVFWSQRYLWDGRAWFDSCFQGYDFQQLLIWHYRNNKSPQSRMGFKQTWEPIFLYRKRGSEKEIKVGADEWGDDLHDFDCHVAAVPQENYKDAEYKQHPAQKPVGVMRWLVNATTRAGELVCDPFCGSGTTGIAAIQLGRRFHGIETNKKFLELTRRRIATYGKQS